MSGSLSIQSSINWVMLFSLLSATALNFCNRFSVGITLSLALGTFAITYTRLLPLQYIIEMSLMGDLNPRDGTNLAKGTLHMSIIAKEWQPILVSMGVDQKIIADFKELQSSLEVRYGSEKTQESFHCAITVFAHNALKESDVLEIAKSLSTIYERMPTIMEYPVLLSELESHLRIKCNNPLAYVPKSFYKDASLYAKKLIVPVGDEEFGFDALVHFSVVGDLAEINNKNLHELRKFIHIVRPKKSKPKTIKVKPENKQGRIVKKSNFVERIVSDKLASEVDGEREVLTVFGRIDVLTDCELIEVKEISAWKSAIGQVLAYGVDYPNHQKRIHLYGKSRTISSAAIADFCIPLGIFVTFE